MSIPGVNTKENFFLLVTFFVGLSCAFDVELETTWNQGEIFFSLFSLGSGGSLM